MSFIEISDWAGGQARPKELLQGLVVMEDDWPEEGYRKPDLVGTCGQHSDKVLARTIGVSGPRNRGMSRTAVHASPNEIVVSLGSGHNHRIVTAAYLSPDQALEIAFRLMKAVKDIGDEE